MNRFYVAVPCALLLGFGIFHQRDQVTREKLEAVHAAKLAAEKRAAEEKTERLRSEAADHARLAAEEHTKQERERADKKRREFDSAMQQLASEATAHADEVAKLTRDADASERHLGELRAAAEKAERETFEFAKRVEDDRVRRRNADLETQRAAHLLATRLAASPLTAAPASPLAPER